MVGMGWMDGMGRKSLKALILRAPLCGANKTKQSLPLSFTEMNQSSPEDVLRFLLVLLELLVRFWYVLVFTWKLIE